MRPAADIIARALDDGLRAEVIKRYGYLSEDVLRAEDIASAAPRIRHGIKLLMAFHKAARGALEEVSDVGS